MKVTVKTDTTQDVVLEEGSVVEALLESLGINRETVLVKKGGMICLEEEPLKEGDHIEIITVVSGG